MERVNSSFTIGIRELFRIIIPGLLVVTFLRLEVPCLLAPSGYELPFGFFLVIAFFIGLVVYILQLYRFCPPWSKIYRKQLSRLDREVRIAMGGASPLLTTDYDAEYKYFLELKTDRSFVERIHYFTSFYYLLAEISQLLFVFSLVEIYFVFSRSLLYLIGVISFLALSYLSYKYSAYQFEKTINEQLMVVKLNQNEFKTIQKQLESADLSTVLINKCDSLLKEIVLDPIKRDYQIYCEKRYSEDWKTGLKTVVYILKVYTSYPISVSGEPGGYKGFYKERIEAILNDIVSFYRTETLQSKAILEIFPSEVEKDVIESIVPLDKAYNSIIKRGSPVLEVAKKYDIKYILVRGRHLVGPNPGLVQVVENICEKESIKSALDLFTGTGIIPIVLHRYKVPNITCVDNGKHFDVVKKTLNIPDGIKCIKKNAFHFLICEDYDLIIADPYYEDSFDFLNKRILDIYQNTKHFVFVCCGSEDEYLRSQCQSIIQAHFKKNTEEQLHFGQSIFICKK